MKDRPKQVLRKVLLSALASVFGTSSNAGEMLNPGSISAVNDGMKELESMSNRIYKNVLKMNPSGGVTEVNGHRSHSSHSSHRSGSYVRNHSSHTSHSSSSGGYGTYTPRRSTSTSIGATTIGTSTSSGSTGNGTNTYSGSSRSTGKGAGLYSNTVSKTIDLKAVEMGDRTMMVNLYGNDISKLVKLLAEKMYIRESWVSKKDGFMLYDSKVEEAVKHFQKDAGLTPSGQLDNSVLQLLKNWDKEKTTITLGVRDLYYVEEMPMFGHDVDELVTLLWAKGIVPSPSMLEKRDGHAVFTHDVEMAVKVYQANNGMSDTGKVDEAFVKSLKASTNDNSD